MIVTIFVGMVLIFTMLIEELLHLSPIAEGASVTLAGDTYTLRDGILRQSLPSSASQEQVRDTYAYLWRHDTDYGSAGHLDYLRRGLERDYPHHMANMGDWLRDDAVIIDAGCGAGYSAIAFFGDHLRRVRYLGIDIADTLDVAARNFRQRAYPADFLLADLARLPFPEPVADVLFCQGVLHHTDDPRATMARLAALVKPRGHVFLTCYRTQPPMREYADVLVHQAIKDDPPDVALEKLKPLTQLGIQLGKMDATVVVNEDIKVLGIDKGEYPLQSFFYDFLFRASHHPGETFDRLNFLNYDWYRPVNRHKMTAAEVATLCEDVGLTVETLSGTRAMVAVVARAG